MTTAKLLALNSTEAGAVLVAAAGHTLQAFHRAYVNTAANPLVHLQPSLCGDLPARAKAF